MGPATEIVVFLSLSFIIGLLFEILKRLKKIEQRMEKEDEK